MKKHFPKHQAETEAPVIGWAVAAVAWRDTAEQIQVRLRPFTVGLDFATSAEDAEQYVYKRMTELWAPEVGWIIDVSAMPVHGLTEGVRG